MREDAANTNAIASGLVLAAVVGAVVFSFQIYRLHERTMPWALKDGQYSMVFPMIAWPLGAFAGVVTAVALAMILGRPSKRHVMLWALATGLSVGGADISYLPGNLVDEFTKSALVCLRPWSLTQVLVGGLCLAWWWRHPG